MTHEGASRIPWPKLARMENQAMWRAQRCQVPDSKSLSGAQLKAQAADRAKAKAAADASINARIIRAISRQAMTMAEIGQFAGIGRHKARTVLRGMEAEGRAEPFRVENATYWRAVQ